MKHKDINYVVQNTLVDLAGACFWFWSSFEHFLLSCGVPRDIYEAQGPRRTSKYQVMRGVITSLKIRGELEPINNMVNEFYAMNDPVDSEEFLDGQKARTLLRTLKDVVDARRPRRHPDQEQITARKLSAKQQAAQAQGRVQSMAELNSEFLGLTRLEGGMSSQQRGLEFEKIVSKLAKLEGIFEEAPYNSTSAQIDGRLRFDGFDYLLEIKWQTGRVQPKEIDAFEAKIERRAQSTRGVFISMSGFTDGAVANIRNVQGRLILIDGREFAGILQGIETLTEVLARKVRALVNHGDPYHRINNNP